jgi:hypothetical protein
MVAAVLLDKGVEKQCNNELFINKSNCEAVSSLGSLINEKGEKTHSSCNSRSATAIG